MNDKQKKRQRAHDQAVIQILQHYGLACEGFGRASEGSPRGMENMMRLAREAAQDILYVFLDREPTLEELQQIPPLYERPTCYLPLSKISAEKPRRPPKKVKH